MPLSPSLWHQERVPGAVIERDMDPDPAVPPNNSAYVPFPVRRASDGQLLCYVKEESPEFRIALFDSGDGETFEHVGTALAAGSTGTWDAGGVSEPAGYYDEATNTIHLLYKGWGTSQDNFPTGYATALASAPTTFTRQNGGAPILEMAEVAGVLGAELVTNSYLWSEDLTHAAWSKIAVTVSGNAGTAPDGDDTADLVVPSTASSNHFLEQTLPALTTATAQSLSFYAKPGGYDWIYVRTINKANATSGSWINVATGATGTVAPAHTVAVEAADHGFYRISVVWNAGTGGTTPRALVGPAPTNGTSTFVGNGTSGACLWGMQLEVDTAAPSDYYVATTGAAVTAAPTAYDHGVSSVLKIGGEWYAYGYIATEEEGYQIYYASGASLTALTPQGVVLSPPAGYELVYAPAVFRHPTAAVYCMVYTQGVEIDSQSRYHLRSAWSVDGVAWTPFGDWFSIPAGWADQEGFERRHYAGRFLMEGGDDYSLPVAFDDTGALPFYFSVSGGGDQVALLKVRTEARASQAAEPRNTLTVNRNEALSVLTETWTPIPFTQRVVVVLDDMIQLDALTTEQTDVTIRESGLYHLEFWLSFAPSALGSRQAYVVVNGGATPIVDVWAGDALVETKLRASCLHPLQGGDVLQLRCWQDSGGTLDLALANMFPTLQVRRIGD